MEQGYSLGNIFRNTTKKQRIGFGLAFVIIVVLVIILFLLVGLPQENSDNTDNNGSTEELIEDGIGSASFEEGVSGADLNKGNNDEDNSVNVPVSVDYNENHEYTLIEYIPKSKYDYITYGDNQHGLRAYWVINENTAIKKGIGVSVDSCDVEGNKVAANNYLKSLPVDLSDYFIVYRVHEGDIPCDVKIK